MFVHKVTDKPNYFYLRFLFLSKKKSFLVIIHPVRQMPDPTG